jgi:small conductance mechanosensitive channel
MNMNTGFSQLDQIKGTLIDLAIRFGPKLLAAILIMTAGAFAAGWAGRMTVRGAAAGELNLSIVEELRRRDISIPFPRHEVRLLNAA